MPTILWMASMELRECTAWSCCSRFITSINMELHSPMLILLSTQFWQVWCFYFSILEKEPNVSREMLEA